MNWFKDFFKKKKPKYEYINPVSYIFQYENGGYEELTTKELIDKYGDFMSEEDKRQIMNFTAPPEIDKIVSCLYMICGVYKKNKQTYDWSLEAIQYADINNWANEPKTNKEYINKQKFLIKAKSYLMRKIYSHDVKYCNILKKSETFGLEFCDDQLANMMFHDSPDELMISDFINAKNK